VPNSLAWPFPRVRVRHAEAPATGNDWFRSRVLNYPGDGGQAGNSMFSAGDGLLAPTRPGLAFKSGVAESSW
jgi:hypothetical protein